MKTIQDFYDEIIKDFETRVGDPYPCWPSWELTKSIIKLGKKKGKVFSSQETIFINYGEISLRTCWITHSINSISSVTESYFIVFNKEKQTEVIGYMRSTTEKIIERLIKEANESKNNDYFKEEILKLKYKYLPPPSIQFIKKCG